MSSQLCVFEPGGLLKFAGGPRGINILCERYKVRTLPTLRSTYQLNARLTEIPVVT